MGAANPSGITPVMPIASSRYLHHARAGATKHKQEKASTVHLLQGLHTRAGLGTMPTRCAYRAAGHMLLLGARFTHNQIRFGKSISQGRETHREDQGTGEGGTYDVLLEARVTRFATTWKAAGMPSNRTRTSNTMSVWLPGAAARQTTHTCASVTEKVCVWRGGG